MKDPRLQILAKTLVNYSTHVNPGEHVLIRGHSNARPLILEIIKAIQEVGGYPHFSLLDDEITRQIMMKVDDQYYNIAAKWRESQFSDIDASISIYSEDNDSELSDVPAENRMLAAKRLKPSSNILMKKKWCLLNYPSHGLAQKAQMSYEKFFDYLVDVCTVDYAQMNDALKPLKKLMEKTDKVRITGPNTDLSFSIKGIHAVPCAGNYNIPDGEIFTAPVKTSVNGTITYNTMSPYQGIVYHNVSLTFEDGKIIKCSADKDNESLEKIFNTDEGARYVGEFAIGVNPMVLHPMGDILFDEKIAGSLHFTPGQCYEGEADNGNKSAIHWDLVLIQRKEYGGGEIYFDDVLIRKDGIFVIPELFGLNPENLMKKD
jgi:aminopeptidase